MATLNLTLPASWAELSQQQLDFLLRTIDAVNRANADRKFLSAEDYAAQTAAQVATRCIFRWSGLRVVTPYADAWLVARDGREYLVAGNDIAAAAQALSWMAELPDVPVRIESIDGATAVDASLDDTFSFDDWLTCETLWQVHQTTKDDNPLRQMAETLYRRPGIRLKPHHLLGIFYWWAGLKAECNRLYPDFFKPAPAATSAEPTPDSLRRSMDSQIRALTKGDITKEQHVLSMPAHRALTELDALAREYDELNQKYPKS